MTEKKQISVSKKRNVRTYAKMWNISRALLQSGKGNPQFSNHHFTASIVFTAFTLEAYLNHIGLQLFNCWGVIEKLSPKDKLNVIIEKIGLEVNFGNRPWQVINNLFGFRNDIAHGKSTEVVENIILNTDNLDNSIIYDLAKTKWEKYCTEKNAERARKDIYQIVILLHDTAGINEQPFNAGIQMSNVEVIDHL